MEIQDAFDLRRMFFGDLPLLFYLEIVVRTTILYGYALFTIRLMGKRGMSELSAFDYVIVIALGSAVGDPMFYPQVPLLAGMTVITVVVLLERVLAYSVQSSERVETFVEGRPIRLVADGHLDVIGTGKEPLAREELFSILRSEGAEQLGQVKRAYLEQNGKLSVFLYEKEEVHPGLPLIPPWDLKSPSCFLAETVVPSPGPYSCRNCGETVAYGPGAQLTLCPNCYKDEWTYAAVRPLEELENEIR